MYKIAFVATGYILDYDGVSVYIENLVLRLLESESYTNGALWIDLYLSRSAAALFEERVLSQADRQYLKVIVIDDTKSWKKFLSLQYRVLSGGRYSLVFMPNPMPLFFSFGRRMKVIHDLTIRRTPELFSKKLHLYIDFLIGYMRRFDDAIGYISEQTKDDIARFYDIHEDQKKLCYLPNGIPFKVQNYTRPDLAESVQKYNSAKQLSLVVVGRINRSKGFDRILAFLRYFDRQLATEKIFEEVVLHVAGKQTEETHKILEEAQFRHITLLFHGYVSDDTLNALYQKSHFCFFLSRNEGYGLPLVEAMWMRTIPVISDIPIFHEIMGESYIKFSDESGYEEAIGNFIKKVFDDTSYRESLFATLDNIVEKEKNGYRVAAENLIAYTKGER